MYIDTWLFDAEGLEFWMFDFYEKFIEGGQTDLSKAEEDAWFALLEKFQQANAGLPGLYGKPIDYSISPTSLLELAKTAYNADCKSNELIIENE